MLPNHINQNKQLFLNMVSTTTSKDIYNIIDNILLFINDDDMIQKIYTLKNIISLHSRTIDYYAYNNIKLNKQINKFKNCIAYIPKLLLCKTCKINNIYSKASLLCGSITHNKTIHENYYCEYHALLLFYNNNNKYIYLKEIISPIPYVYIYNYITYCISHNNYNRYYYAV